MDINLQAPIAEAPVHRDTIIAEAAAVDLLLRTDPEAVQGVLALLPEGVPAEAVLPQAQVPVLAAPAAVDPDRYLASKLKV